MWNKNERNGTADQAKGRVKQAAGALSGDPGLKAEGVIDESRGNIEVAVGRLRRKSDTIFAGARKALKS